MDSRISVMSTHGFRLASRAGSTEVERGREERKDGEGGVIGEEETSEVERPAGDTSKNRV